MQLQGGYVLKLFPALLFAGAIAAAQTHQHGPPETARIDLAKLPPPYRIEGIGQAHIPITTASPKAQEWFDQGLALLHCFWDYEAERAFEESVRLDPECAMCHWGLFQALDFSGEHDQAKAELARAKELSAQGFRPGATLYSGQHRAAGQARRGSHAGVHQGNGSARRPLSRRSAGQANSREKLDSMAMTVRAIRAPAPSMAKRFCGICCTIIPTTPPSIITGFTPWKEAAIQSGRWKAPKSLVSWRPLPATWSTCPATSSIASAITSGRGRSSSKLQRVDHDYMDEAARQHPRPLELRSQPELLDRRLRRGRPVSGSAPARLHAARDGGRSGSDHRTRGSTFCRSAVRPRALRFDSGLGMRPSNSP